MASDLFIDDAPVTAFHRRLTLYSAGGPFLDGYILSMIGVALTLLAPQLHLNAFWMGLVGASSLAGLLIGGLVFGYVTDLVGRQLMYMIDLTVVIVFSVLQMFVHNATELVILRFIIGIAIGADYPISTALVAEFAPKKNRAFLVGSLTGMWYFGATVADVIGFLLLGLGPDAWKWMLGSSAIPAVAIVIMRLGIPESPRWLISKNRTDEARAIVKRVYGENFDIKDLADPVEKTRFFKMFEAGYAKRTWFVAVFWACTVIPIFAIYTFGPQILDTFRLNQGNASFIGSAVISLFFFIGCVIALYLVDKMRRRKLLLWCLVVMGIGMLILGVWPNAPVWVIFVGFGLYALFSGGPNILQFIYPNELFPTEIRASAMGFGTAMSRVGAFIGTFALPYSLLKIGVGPTMLIGVALTAIAYIVSVVWAPETQGKTLLEASSLAAHNNVDTHAV